MVTRGDSYENTVGHRYTSSYSYANVHQGVFNSFLAF